MGTKRQMSLFKYLSWGRIKGNIWTRMLFKSITAYLNAVHHG